MRYMKLCSPGPRAEGPGHERAHHLRAGQLSGRRTGARPALIICPGGAYRKLSNREGEPVALRFAGLGYAAFVLYYMGTSRGPGPAGQPPWPGGGGGRRRWPRRRNEEEYSLVHFRTMPAGGHPFPPGAIWRAAPPSCGTSRRSSPPEKESRGLRPDGMVLATRWYPAGRRCPPRLPPKPPGGPVSEEPPETLSLEKQVERGRPSSSGTPPTTPRNRWRYPPAGEGPLGNENPGGDPHLPPRRPRPVPGGPHRLPPGPSVADLRTLRRLGGALPRLAPAEFWPIGRRGA